MSTDTRPLSTEADTAAINALAAEMAAGWAAGDADHFARAFVEDADYIIFNGAHLRGRRAIAEAHRPLFATVLKGTRLDYGREGLPAPRYLTPDVALLVAKDGSPANDDGQLNAGIPSVQTLLAVRQPDGDWKFALFQNTRAARGHPR